jgi:hypothetical protein
LGRQYRCPRNKALQTSNQSFSNRCIQGKPKISLAGLDNDRFTRKHSTLEARKIPQKFGNSRVHDSILSDNFYVKQPCEALFMK